MCQKKKCFYKKNGKWYFLAYYACLKLEILGILYSLEDVAYILSKISCKNQITLSISCQHGTNVFILKWYVWNMETNLILITFVRVKKEKVTFNTKYTIFSLTLQPLNIEKMRQIASTFFKNFPGMTTPDLTSCCDPWLGSFWWRPPHNFWPPVPQYG